jgi:hypothetical protein
LTKNNVLQIHACDGATFFAQAGLQVAAAVVGPVAGDRLVVADFPVWFRRRSFLLQCMPAIVLSGKIVLFEFSV